MKLIATLCIATLLLVTVACAPLEQSARDGIATAKGFLDAEAKAHPECTQTPSAQACTLITKGNALKHVAIDALEQYCTSPGFDAGTDPCTKPTGQAATVAAQQLKTALANLSQVISDIKALK
jgi:hypothetical protein